MPTHLHNPFFKGIEFFCFFTGILFSVSLFFLAPTVASAESRSFAFWRGIDVIDAIKEQAQEYELVLKKLPNGSETTLYSFNHFAMLADAGINSNTAQLTFGRIQASPDGSEIIIGYGVKEPADNVKLARIEKLSLTDGNRSTIKEWNVNSPAGSFNYDFEPLTVDWTNQKIYFFKTNESDKSVDSLVSLSFSGGEVKLIQEIHGSPETIQLDPRNQNVMVMGEDDFEKGLIYVFDQNGITTPIKRTETIPDEHTFSFSASGDEILYLNAPDGGNPSLKSKSISDDSESTRFDYLNLNQGLWDPFANDGDFKDIETFYNEDPSGKIAFVAETLGEYAELVELDLNSGVTTVLSTGEVQVSQKVDSYEDGWLVNFSGTPVAQSQPSSTSVPNASGDYTPVPNPIIPQASSLIANAGPVSDGGHWKQSSWLGYFWEKPNSSWIFHPVLGWLHVVPNNDDSFWVYTQDLFPIPLWLWIQPNQFPYVYAKAAGSRNRRVGETEGVSTTNYDGLISNKYFEWRVNSSQVLDTETPATVIGPILIDKPVLHAGSASFNYFKSLEATTTSKSSDNYLTEHSFARDRVSQNNDIYQFVRTEFFLTDAGHQAHLYHYTERLINSIIINHFSIQIDGSTEGFPQPSGTWLEVLVNFNGVGGVAGNRLELKDVKNSLMGLKFKGGTPKPAIELPEFAGMTPGSIVSESNLPPNSNSVVSETIETTWSNKILSNKYVEWNLGDEWVGYIVKEFPLTGRWNQSNLVFGANKKSNSRVGFVFDLLYEEPINFSGNDNFFEVSQLPLTGAEEILAKETFLTDDGHQAVVVHSQISPPVNNMQSFTFLVDGSTVGFPQPEGTWMKARIGIVTNAPTDGSEPLEILSMADAKSIVNGLKFKGGAPKPAIELPEFAAMTPNPSPSTSSPDSTNPDANTETSSSTPEVSATVATPMSEPDFVNGAWLYLDLDKGSLTHWDKNSNQWGDWSKIAKPNLTGTTSTTSVTEKYQGMEFSKAVESIMNSSKTEDEKKRDLGDLILEK